MPSQPFSGVLVPVLTPFTPAGEPDAGRFVNFCRWLLDQGAGGLAIFGTTSEANSMSGAERMELLDRLIDAGIPAQKLMPGTGACAMTDVVTLVRHAVDRGCGGVLMLPPFYYKGVSDDGIFAFISGVIDRVGSPSTGWRYQPRRSPSSLRMRGTLTPPRPSACASCGATATDSGRSACRESPIARSPRWRSCPCWSARRGPSLPFPLRRIWLPVRAI